MGWGTLLNSLKARGKTAQRVPRGQVRRNRTVLSVEMLEERNLLTVFSEGSVDLALSFDPHQHGKRAWDLVASADAGDFDLNQVRIQLGPNTIQTQPADPRFAFTGASPGDAVWISPEHTIDAVGKVFLSINNEDVHPADIAAYTSSDPRVSSAGPQNWVKISLLGVTGTGPDQGGQFSLWQTGVLGNPILWMSTFANPNPNTLFEVAGTELHFNWGFTAPGEYKVDLQASAFQGPNQTVPTKSHRFMVTFDVLPDAGSGQHTVLTQPADPRFAFTGASPGDAVWISPEHTIDAVGKVFLSINNEDVHPEDIAAYTSSDPRVSSAGPQNWVKISLLGVTGTGPDQGGQFSLWQTDAVGPVLAPS